MLLGGSGFAGSDTAQVLSGDGIPFVSTSRREGVDLRNASEALAFLDKVQPDLTVNCAVHVGMRNRVANSAARTEGSGGRPGVHEGVSRLRVCPIVRENGSHMPMVQVGVAPLERP